jgi:hypothetical protein
MRALTKGHKYVRIIAFFQEEQYSRAKRNEEHETSRALIEVSIKGFESHACWERKETVKPIWVVGRGR